MSVLILMYHGVERRQGPLFVEPELFAQQMTAVAASGLPVLTVGEVGERLREGTLPDAAVALTFDDGFASVVEEAAPKLLERGLRATVFCVAGRLGGTNAWPTALPGAPDVELAGTGELLRLAAAGFEIGAHGMDHAPLDTDDPDEIRREVVDAQTVLARTFDTHVRSFAYPYGASPSRAAELRVSQSYSTACTTRIGRVHDDSNPLDLPRVDAHYLRSRGLFEATLAGRASAYLAIRRIAATARRRVRHDYSRQPSTRMVER
jgi:peptidoglycan/xylan/chitin deacetylase (PgdA/CDA1 family)